MKTAPTNLATSYRTIFHRTWPIVLANSATPFLGLTDTAVIGRTGSTASLGAIALGSLVFSFVYWTFGFLRMGSTGLVSQADGSGDEVEVRAILGRFVLMGTGIGLILILLQIPIFHLAMSILSGSEEVESSASVYLSIRIWGAPATLANYVLMGILIGLGKSRTLLVVQLVLNGLNIVLDVLFAGFFGMGVAGIALGTLIAEWSACLFALSLVLRLLKERQQDNEAFWSWARISNTRQLTRTLGVQGNIMIRTLSLLFGFGWFTQQGAKLGDVTLAANHILLQFISFSAFFLDGIAHATEALVGKAAGARNVDVFTILVRRTMKLAAFLALALGFIFFIFGNLAVSVLTDIDEVKVAALKSLPFSAFYIAVSFGTFQLDGIFIGTTRTREMRNAGLTSLGLYLAIGWPLVNAYGNTGLWLALISFILLRAASLMAYYPKLKRSIRE